MESVQTVMMELIFLADESLEEVLDASSKNSPCTVVSSQENIVLLI